MSMQVTNGFTPSILAQRHMDGLAAARAGQWRGTQAHQFIQGQQHTSYRLPTPPNANTHAACERQCLP